MAAIVKIVYRRPDDSVGHYSTDAADMPDALALAIELCDGCVQAEWRVTKIEIKEKPE